MLIEWYPLPSREEPARLRDALSMACGDRAEKDRGENVGGGRLLRPDRLRLASD